VSYDVLVKFRAAVEGFTGPVELAKAKVLELDAATTKLSQQQNNAARYTQSWSKVSTGMLTLGVGIAAVVAGATAAAIQWETAWTGVAKTVNGTSTEMAKLEGDLKGLARILPVSATEIADVAANAGQLGVRTADIANFTKVMIGLGEATNLTSEEASTDLAQIANIMGVTGDGINRMASTLVGLGNNGASTERDIAEMSLRIAAAGKLIGFSTADVMSFSSALTSVGVNAEAGGTALAQTFGAIRGAVDSGGEALTTLARTAGMTTDQFVRYFKDDAAGAVDAFVEGLGKVEATGASASGVLDQLGMSGIRQQTSLLSLASAGTLLSDQLEIGSQAWQKNTALAQETARRYATTESQMKIAMNNVQQSAAEMGNVMLPILSDASTGVVKLAQSFSSMSSYDKGAVTSLLAVSAGVLLLVGGAMKAVSAAAEFKTAMAVMGVSAEALKGKLSVATVAVLALATAAVAYGAFAANTTKELQRSIVQADALAGSIGGARNAADMVDLNRTFQFDEGWVIKTKVDGLGDSLHMALDPSFFDSVSSAMNGTGSVVQRVESQFGQLDKSLAALRSNGNVDAAAAAFRQVAETKVHYDPTWTQGARDETVAAGKLIELFPQYKAQLDNVASSLKVSGLSAQDYADWMGGKIPLAVQRAMNGNPELLAGLDEQKLALLGTAGAAQSTANALRAQVEATRAVYKATIETSGSLVGLHQAEADAQVQADKTSSKDKKVRAEMAASLNATRTAFNLDTAAGRDNQSALDGVANSQLAVIDAMEKSGEPIAKQNAVTSEARDRFIALAIKMGLTADAAKALADAYGLIPKAVETKVESPGAPIAIHNATELKAALALLPPKTAADVQSAWDAYGYTAAVQALNALDGKHVYTYVDTIYDPVQGSLAAARAAANAGHKATGSWVSGPGTGTSDEAGLYWLSNREFIVRAAAATSIESATPGLLDYLNTHGRLPGLASGGSPGMAYAPASSYSSSATTFVDSSTHLTFGSIDVTASSPDDAIRKLTDTLRAKLAGAGIR